MSIQSWLVLCLHSLCPFTSLMAQDVEKPLQLVVIPIRRPQPPVPNWVLDGLLSALNDPEPGVAEFVPLLAEAMALHFDFGAPEDKKAANALAKHLGTFLTHKDRDVRRSAASALGQMGDAAALQAGALVELLKDQDLDVRISAASALGQMGDAAGSQAWALGELLKDQDSDVRRSAANALGQMGAAAASQAGVLGELLNDQDSDVRRSAANALGQMGAAAASQAGALGELLKDQDCLVRRSAVSVLGRLVEAGHRRQGVEPAFVLKLLRRVQRNEISQTSAICVGHLVCASSAPGRTALALLADRTPGPPSSPHLPDARIAMEHLIKV